MKIAIDFSKHRSIGNGYDETVPDNAKFFEEAEMLYKKYSAHMEDSILQVMESKGAPQGESISIHTSYYPGSKIIKSMVFQIEDIGSGHCSLSLKKAVV